MADREKVLNGLKACANRTGALCRHCPYDFRKESCISDMAEDALELLKKQDAVVPEIEVLNEIDGLYRCPKCHKCFFYEKQKYCDQCGQAVKWE